MKKNTILLTVISFLILFFIQVLLFFFSTLILENQPENNNWGSLITSCSFAITILITLKFFNQKLKINWHFPKLNVLLHIVGLSIITFLLYPVLTTISFVTNINNNIIEFNIPNYTWDINLTITYLNVVVIIPVLEELFYRKIIFDRINQKYNAFWAILISSALFSIFHLNYEQCQIAFTVGLLLGFIYYKTKKIEITILIHMVINLLITFSSNKSVAFNTHYYVAIAYVFLIYFGYLLSKKIIQGNINTRLKTNDK